MEVEANDVAVVIVGMPVHRDADAIYILGEFITGRDVTFHGDAAKRRCHINREDAVLVVDIIKNLQEVTDKWLDGIVGDHVGGAMDVNAEKGIIQGVHRVA